MKKLLTLALVLVALASFTGLGVAQKPEEKTTTVKGSKSNSDNRLSLLKIKILEVNDSAKSFTAMVNAKAVTFLGANTMSLPKAGEIFDLWGDPSNVGNEYIYIGHSMLGANRSTTPSNPSTVRWVCFSHPPFADFRCFDYQPLRLTGKVTQSNEQTKTFAVMAKGNVVTFSGAKLKGVPKVGLIIDITYTQTPGGPMEATNLNSSKSNIY